MKLYLKIGTAALLCLIGMAAASIAETKYIVEEFEVPMRTGTSTEHKILALIPSGRDVEVLTAGDEWSEVRLASGKQGWVLSRYLSTEMPNTLKLERLEKKYEELLGQKKNLDQTTSELDGARTELSSALSQAQKQLAALTTAHEALKSESAEFIELKKNYETAVKELEQTRTHAEKMESDLNRLSNNQVYQGMLYGGGLIALGFVVGFIVKKPRRRSPLM